jgi:hypothetical protein
MTPKEKAEELYRKYWVYFTYEQSVNSIFKHAKECAIIVVDEILLEIDDNYDSMHSSDRKLYWQEVKQEIENL